MAERDEKTSKTIIVLRPPSTEFFPNHPQRIKKWGPLTLKGKRGRGWLIGIFDLIFN